MSEIGNSSKVHCPFCGTDNEGGTKFCGNCGTKLDEQQAAEGQTGPASGYQEEINIKYEPVNSTYSSSADSSSAGQNAGIPNYEGPVYGQVQNADDNKGLAIASMVCGIISIVCCCAWYLSIILAIVGLVLGIVSLKKQQGGRSMAIAGIITSAIGIFLTVALGVLIVIGYAADSMYYSDFFDYLY